MEILKSKRFVMRKTLIGKNQVVEFTNKKGDVVTYDHDKAFEIMQVTLEALNCWNKYKSYTASGNIPKILRGTDAVISRVDSTPEPVVETIDESGEFEVAAAISEEAEMERLIAEESTNEASYEAAF